MNWNYLFMRGYLIDTVAFGSGAFGVSISENSSNSLFINQFNSL